MSNSNFLWEIILRELKNEVSPQVFETWFTGASIDRVDFENRIIVLTSKEALVSQFIQGAYDDKLKSILKNTTGLDFVIEYDSLDNNFTLPTKRSSFEPTPAEEIIKQNFLQGDKPAGAQHFYQKQSFPLDDYKKPEPNKKVTLSKRNPTLNKNYTFENFVVGEGNAFTHNIAWNVAVSPGGIYNPLFIYGGVGLGKTHLLHAIGNEMEANFPDFKIECISSEKFLNEFLASIKPQKGSTLSSKDEDFRRKYRDVDALLIDDIQFLSGKTETQNAFFHTFNELQMNQKQIVLVSDRAPSQLNDLEDRLVTRFRQGITADITPPDFETRMAILKYKCEQFDIKLDEETLTYIANNVSSNIRVLEGVVKSIKFTASSKHVEPSLQIAETILKDSNTTSRKNISPDSIISVCADFYKIKKDDLLSASRKKEVVKVRNIAIYLCRELTTLSFPAIGEHFNKDHTSILYSFNKIAKLEKDEEPDILDDIEAIKQRLSKM